MIAQINWLNVDLRHFFIIKRTNSRLNRRFLAAVLLGEIIELLQDIRRRVDDGKARCIAPVFVVVFICHFIDALSKNSQVIADI